VSPATAAAHHATLSGIAWLIAGTACYAVMDALSRVAGPLYGVPLIMVVRYGVHALAMGLWRWVRHARGAPVVHASTPWRQGVRGVALFAAASLAVLALQHMPVAEYTAVVLLTPLIVTLLAWALLKQRVTAWQGLLVAGGFVGALIVIRPGSGLFGWGAALALGVAAFNAVYQLITNRFGSQEDAVVTNFHSGWIGLLLSCVWLALAQDSVPAALLQHGPSVTDLALLLSIGALATVAQLVLIMALARAPAATLMPFCYGQLGFGAWAGWLALGDVPDAWAWLGMAVIATCGVAAAWHAATRAARQTRPVHPTTLSSPSAAAASNTVPPSQA
jgi:drug/metabolite transporter (DMT)-like permease